MITAHIIEACWIIFLVVWLFAANWSKNVKTQNSVRNELTYRLFWVLAFVFLFMGGAFVYEYPFSRMIVPQTHVSELIAIICTVLGLLLAIWSRMSLGNNWSAAPQIKENHELVTSGPYAFVRHPIYTAVILMYFGTALSLGTLGGFVGLAFLIIGCSFKLRMEEKFMLQQFPDQYPAYAKRVKRLIPFIV